MKKILYITANSKPENISSSKIVGRTLVNRFMEMHPDFTLEELDLYEDYIPRPKYTYYESRSGLVSGDALEDLPMNEQEDVRRMEQLCDQFIEASVYILVAPMWSLSFPAVVKEYIDCIVQGEKTIEFKNNKPKGLLCNRPRSFIYVQSSGTIVPWIGKPMLNRGINYVEDIMKFIGIGQFEELLVDGTGTTEGERITAIEDAKVLIDDLVAKIKVEKYAMHY